MLQIPECFYRISIKALICDAEWKFMLIQERDGKRELPWWGLDHGELPAAWLAREIREEMRLEVDRVAEEPLCMTTHTIRYESGIARRADIVYETSVVHDAFTPSDECLAIKYFSLAEAREIDVYPSTTKFLDAYEKILSAERSE